MYSKSQGIFAPDVSSKNSFKKLVNDLLFYCAVGDALGAGIEFWSLKKILAIYGDARNIQYTREWPSKKAPPVYVAGGMAGDVTDDTIMVLCIMVALTKTLKQWSLANKSITNNSSKAFQQDALNNIFQSFLFWAQNQDFYPQQYAAQCKNFILDNDWPQIEVFKNVNGMGETCLKILSQGKIGTFEDLPSANPNEPDSKPYYSVGCGALIRVMPVGIFCSQFKCIDPFEFGCQTGVLTHGYATAYLSAGLLAELITEIIESKSIYQSLIKVRDKSLARRDAEQSEDIKAGYNGCFRAIEIAFESLRDSDYYPIETLDLIGYSMASKDQLFTSAPVLAQVLFVALAAEKHDWTSDRALKFSVTQTGDSDSVGAVVGGLLAARGRPVSFITNKLIRELNPNHHNAISAAADEFSSLALQHKTKLEIDIEPARTAFAM